MQYLLNQTEYDEYVMLKENSSAFNNDNRDLSELIKLWRVEKIILTSMPPITQYHIVVNESNLPKDLKSALASATYNGIMTR